MTKIYLSSQYNYDGKSIFDLDYKQKITKLKMLIDFNKDILKWENNRCRCSFKEDLILSMRDRRGFNVRTVLCMNCGLIRADPRISEETIDIFYEKYYRNLVPISHNEIGENLISATYNKENRHGKKVLEFIKRNTSLKNGLVFDFGAGTGGMLKIFENAGFEIFGVDLNERFLNYGLKKGLNLKKGSINELKSYSKKANLIIASHILEHLHSLDKYLRKLWECLEDEGYLYVELPGFYNVHKSYKNFLPFFLIEHFYYFTLLTLSKVLGENRFKLIAGNETISALFQKSSKKHNIRISKDYIENILIYLRIVDIPLPINVCKLINNKKKIKYNIILTIISIIYKTRFIDFIAFLKLFVKKNFKDSNLIKFVKNII